MSDKSTAKPHFITIQRPRIVGRSLLLIYSDDGVDIPVTMVPDEGTLKTALGKSKKVSFAYTRAKDQIILGQEVARI